MGIDLEALSLSLREVVRLTGVGGAVHLWLPPEAMEGWKPQSFPNEELVYEVEIVGESTPAAPRIYGSPKDASSALGTQASIAALPPAAPDLAGAPKDARKTRSGLEYVVSNQGTGAHLKGTAKCHVNFSAWAIRGLTLQAVEHDKTVVVTTSSAPAGIGEVLEQLGRGGRARLWVPAAKAASVLPEYKDQALIVDITLNEVDAG